MREPSAQNSSRRAKAGPFAGFRRDHARVIARLANVEREILSPRGLRRGAHDRIAQLVALLERQFSTHMAAEDTLLYPLLSDLLPEVRTALAPLAEDHAELRSLLASLAESLARDAGRPRDELLAVQLRDLVDLLRLHIRREESAVFEVAERILGEREASEIEKRLSQFVSLLSPNPARGASRPVPVRRARERKS